MDFKIKVFSINELKRLVEPEQLLPFNREIMPKHVGEMVESIKECGVLRVPIIGKLNYNGGLPYAIIDGQHLITAIIQLDESSGTDLVKCIMKEYDNKKDVIKTVAKINNTQRPWVDLTYLNAWYLFGDENEHFENYEYVNHLHTTDNLPCSFIVQLYSTTKDKFKEGEMVFRDKAFCDKVYKLALMLKNQYDVAGACLYGLERWAKVRHFKDKKQIDFQKLASRIRAGIRNKERGAM